MATLTLPSKTEKSGSKPAMTKYIVEKFIYAAPNSYPMPIGSVQEFADNAETENLVKLGFLRPVDAEVVGDAKVFNANLDLRPTLAMPPSPPLSQPMPHPLTLPRA